MRKTATILLLLLLGYAIGHGFRAWQNSYVRFEPTLEQLDQLPAGSVEFRDGEFWIRRKDRR